MLILFQVTRDGRVAHKWTLHMVVVVVIKTQLSWSVVGAQKKKCDFSFVLLAKAI